MENIDWDYVKQSNGADTKCSLHRDTYTQQRTHCTQSCCTALSIKFDCDPILLLKSIEPADTKYSLYILFLICELQYWHMNWVNRM